jgi:putative flippase GtrA
VSTTRELYGRFRHLIHEGAKFLVVGGIGTVVTFGLTNALTKTVGEYGAVTIATAVATAVTFAGNRYWTFRHRQSTGNTARESAMFFILNGIGLLIFYGCLGLKDLAGLEGKLWLNVALVVGTGLGTLFRFWSYRKWVWVAAPTTGPPAGPERAEALTPELAGAVEAVRPAPAVRVPASHRRR